MITVFIMMLKKSGIYTSSIGFGLGVSISDINLASDTIFM